jgi:hypothetical protein
MYNTVNTAEAKVNTNQQVSETLTRITGQFNRTVLHYQATGQRAILMAFITVNCSLQDTNFFVQ